MPMQQNVIIVAPEPEAVPEPTPAPAPTPAVALPPLPSHEEFLANWPRFLGPTGNGVSSQTVAPMKWSESENVIWKTPILRPGFNSPLVWGDRVFISGGDAQERAVMAYSAADGSLLWERVIKDVPGSPAKPPDIPDMTGYAASTMATDGRCVYVIFPNGDLAMPLYRLQRTACPNLTAFATVASKNGAPGPAVR